jgi:synapsin
MGTSMLEQIPMNNKYKIWIDEVSKLFGGLDIFSIEIVVGQDSKEYIIDINDSSMTLFGESQEEDKRFIADLVLEKMALVCKPKSIEASKIQQASRPHEDPTKSIPSATSSHSSISSINSVSKESLSIRQLPAQPLRQSSISSEKSNMNKSFNEEQSTIINSNQEAEKKQNQINMQQNQPRPPARPQILPQQSHLKTQIRPNIPNNAMRSQKQQNNDDGEDTMKNLRKTFAGIFGDMSASKNETKSKKK